MTPCDEIQAHLGGYVLDGLEADERTWVEEHLGDCGGCRAELRELAELPGLLALVPEAPPAPPEELRQRVMAQAGRPRAARRPLALLVAAALGLGVLIGVAVIPAVQLGRPEPLASVDLTPGEGFDTRGSASFAASREGLRIDLALEGLPPLPREAVFEAWLAAPDADQPTSIGQFAPEPDGTAVVTLGADGRLEDYEGVWVTAEPDASSPSHDGPTVVAAVLGDSEHSWPDH